MSIINPLSIKTQLPIGEITPEQLQVLPNKVTTTASAILNSSAIPEKRAFSKNKSEINSSTGPITKENISLKLKEIFCLKSEEGPYIPGHIARKIINLINTLQPNNEKDENVCSILIEGLYEELQSMEKNQTDIDRFYAEMMEIVRKAVKSDVVDGNILLDVICRYGKKDTKIFAEKVYQAFKSDPNKLNKITEMATKHELNLHKDNLSFRGTSFCTELSKARINNDPDTLKFLSSLKKHIKKSIGKSGLKVSINEKAIGIKWNINDYGDQTIQSKVDENKERFTDLCRTTLDFITSTTLPKSFREVVAIRHKVVADSQFSSFADTADSEFISLSTIVNYLTNPNTNYDTTELKRSIINDLCKVFQKCAHLVNNLETKKFEIATITDQVFLDISKDFKEKYINFIKVNSSI